MSEEAVAQLKNAIKRMPSRKDVLPRKEWYNWGELFAYDGKKRCPRVKPHTARARKQPRPTPFLTWPYTRVDDGG